MTDSIVQFKYSDDVHLIALYIRSDTHQEKFIPDLFEIAKSCEYTSLNRSFDYVVAEMVSKIVSKYESSVKIILESQVGYKIACYKYCISINEGYYKKSNSILHSKSLKDYITIKCLNTPNPFDGLLKDFYQKVVSGNNTYLIKELEAKIKSHKEKIKKLKQKND
jgi:hypothetical protein